MPFRIVEYNSELFLHMLFRIVEYNPALTPISASAERSIKKAVEIINFFE